MTDGSNVNIDIEYEDLQKVLDDLSNSQLQVSEAAGNHRSKIKGHLDSTGWNKSALAIIRQIDGMSQTKRNDFLGTFDPLFDVMHAKKWADERQDLFDDPTERED